MKLCIFLALAIAFVGIKGVPLIEESEPIAQTFNIANASMGILGKAFNCPIGDIAFPGNNIGSPIKVSSWAYCGKLCSMVSLCKYWTYYSDGYCYAKTSTAGIGVSTGAKSGSRGCK